MAQHHRPAGRNHSRYCSHAGEPTGCLTGCGVTHGHYISLNKTRSAARAEGSVLLAFEERCAAKRQLTLLLYPDSQRLPFPPRRSTEGGVDMLLSQERGWAPTVHTQCHILTLDYNIINSSALSVFWSKSKMSTWPCQEVRVWEANTGNYGRSCVRSPVNHVAEAPRTLSTL